MAKLTTAAASASRLGQSRVKPSVCLSAMAHTISSRPAARRTAQAMSGSEAAVDGDGGAGDVAPHSPRR
jgi:hypothetical protein